MKKRGCLYKNYSYWHKIERVLISLQVETSRLLIGSQKIKDVPSLLKMQVQRTRRFAFTHTKKVSMCNLPTKSEPLKERKREKYFTSCKCMNN